MGIPVQYDEFGQPISPRFVEATAAKESEGSFAVTSRVRAWLSEWREGFVAFSEEMGCEPDVMLLVVAGLISQDVQIVADAMERNTRWVHPRVKRLQEMGMWVGEDKLGRRFDVWYAAMADNPNAEIGPELYLPVVLDILEIDGLIESRQGEDGEIRYYPKNEAVRAAIIHGALDTER